MKKKITGVLIVAAGKGIRSKSIIPKQYLNFGNQMILEKNIKTSVPQFIAVNDKIVISTVDGSYIEKSKN